MCIRDRLSVIAIGMQITYDDRDGQPSTTDSNQGYALLNRHFPRDITIAEFIVISAPTDLRTAKGLADLDQMASRIAQVPGVTRVVGVTRPTGAKLDQAKLSFQNGQIGDRVSGAVREGQARQGDLDQLRSGANQLADGLGQLDTQIRTNLAPLSEILDQVTTVGDNINQYLSLIHISEPTRPY